MSGIANLFKIFSDLKLNRNWVHDKDLCSQYKRIVSIPTTKINLNSDEWCAL